MERKHRARQFCDRHIVVKRRAGKAQVFVFRRFVQRGFQTSLPIRDVRHVQNDHVLQPERQIARAADARSVEQNRPLAPFRGADRQRKCDHRLSDAAAA